MSGATGGFTTLTGTGTIGASAADSILASIASTDATTTAGSVSIEVSTLYSTGANVYATYTTEANGDVTMVTTSALILEATATTSFTTTLALTTSQFSTSTSRQASSSTNTSLAKPTSTTTKTEGTNVTAIAAGVTVPVVILSLLFIGFLLFRRNKRRRHDERHKAQSQTHLAEPQDHHEKPELQGGPYDASIAGPVQPKSELHSKSAQTRSEGIYPAVQPSSSELSGEPSAYELGLGSLRDREKKALLQRSEYSEPGSQPSSTVVASSSQRSKTAATATNEAEQYDADLIAEADDLVQELGLITSRKRRLEKSALTTNTKPEDVEGSKGEDYRELLRREERLRRRMEEIAEERSGTG